MADPYKLELPDGTQYDIPAMPTEEQNRLIQDIFVQHGLVKEPKRVTVGLFGPQRLKVTESTARTLTNLGGEIPASILGGLGGAAAGTALAAPTGGIANPATGGIAGRALGAVAGRKLISEPLQKAMGVPPQPMGIPEAIGLAGMSAVGDVGANLVSKAARGGVGLLARAPGRASAEERRYLYKLYRDNGIDPPSPSSIMQSKALQGAFGYTQKSLYASGVTTDFLKRQEQRTLEAILGKTAKPGSLYGGYEAGEVGKILASGPRRAQAEFQTEARRLFNEARKLRPPNLTVTLDRTMDQMDATLYQHVVDIASAAGGTKIASMAKKIQRAIAQGQPVLFEDLERLRSFAGRQIPKTVGPERGELKMFFGRLTDDMEAGLDASRGIDPRAVTSWREARNHYREGMKKIDDFYAKINKKVTPEEVTYEIQKYIEGSSPNLTRLQEIRSTLTDDEWQPFMDYFVRKNLVSADGEQFLGFQHFMERAKNWTPKMKDAVFGADTEYRKWIDQLGYIAKNEAEYGAGGVQRNPLMIASEIVGPVSAGGVAVAAGKPFLALVTAGTYPLGMNALGRLLSSEVMLKWVVEGAKMAPNKWASHFGALAGIAAYEEPEVQEAIVEMIQNMQSSMESAPQGMWGSGLFGGR